MLEENLKEKNKEETKGDNFLLYVPKKKHVEYEVRNHRVFLIFHHTKPIEKLLRWLVKKPYISDVELDEIGSEIWKLIDGNTSVYEIGQKLFEKFGKKCEPIYDRLILYLRYLNKKGWVSFEKKK